jgi:hypothetical protein
MKKILLAASVALMTASGAAFAQTADQTHDQSMTGGQGGMNTPERVPVEPYQVPPDVTTGMGPGVVVVPGPMPKGPVRQGPINCPSDGESSQGNVGPGTGC